MIKMGVRSVSDLAEGVALTESEPLAGDTPAGTSGPETPPMARGATRTPELSESDSPTGSADVVDPDRAEDAATIEELEDQ
ncbi:MAG TPA: hypothetical protein VGF84_18230, partial [Micromonosporaceae bacterium]